MSEDVKPPAEEHSAISRAFSWTNDPDKVKKFFWALVAGGAVLTLFDLFYKKKSYFDIEQVFGFYSLYTLAGCALFVLVAKAVRIFLKRRETYYAPADVDGEPHPAFDLERSEDDV